MTIDLTIDPMHPWSTLERFVTLAIAWAIAHTTPHLDMIDGVLTLLAIFAGLMLLFAPESGRHRAGLLAPARKRKPAAARRHLALVVDLPRAPKRDFSFSADNTQPVAHHDADTFQPLAEIAAVDTPDAEWEALMARARRELHEIHADDSIFFAQWDAMVANFRRQIDASLATAQDWHAEHGRHCECCHVDTGTGEQAVIWAQWRIGEDTIEISRDQLAAVGIR